MAKLFVCGWSACPMTSEKLLFSIMTIMMCGAGGGAVVVVVVVVVGVLVVETAVVGLPELHAATSRASSAVAVPTRDVLGLAEG